jgi:UDP-N-acetylglucosamine--N-acetylmuramyl-(pentapeptide) pyrophosphoryl-undecaprenol N-acetylglucosamine transferase
MAAQKNIPTVIQEQNSYPGITNRLLSKKAKRICVAYDGMGNYFPKEKILLTGNPVRSNILETHSKKDEAIKFFNLNKNVKTILVVGGSQGARSINRSIAAGLKKISAQHVQLIWQTGQLFFAEAEKVIAENEDANLKAFDFISKMDLAYAVADLVIARAGASTVSELCIVGKPAIMVPLPTAAEDHQTKNIQSLVNKNAALMIKDSEAQQKLVDEALLLVNDSIKLKSLSENILKLALPNSAEIIAKEVIRIAGFTV